VQRTKDYQKKLRNVNQNGREIQANQERDGEAITLNSPIFDDDNESKVLLLLLLLLLKELLCVL
jgi:uncharacterized membrane protein